MYQSGIEKNIKKVYILITMPELPEVETIKRQLEKNVLGKDILSVDIFDKRVVVNEKEFVKGLLNKKLKSIERVGKVLIFQINKNSFLLIHLRMTGQLVYKKDNNFIAGGHPIDNAFNVPNKFTCVVFKFSDGSCLFFNSTRKFSRTSLVSKIEKEKYVDKFGIDPTKKEFTYKKFKKELENKKVSLKSFLLNQKYISGIGNIYADEVCFFAFVLPDRKVYSLTEKEKELLFVGTKIILKKAVEKGGTTFRDYLTAEGKKGGYVKYLRVYGWAEKECLNMCGGIILKKVVAGRGTHFCKNCQK